MNSNIKFQLWHTWKSHAQIYFSRDIKKKQKKTKNNDKRRRDMVVGKVHGGAFMSNTNYQRIET